MKQTQTMPKRYTSIWQNIVYAYRLLFQSSPIAILAVPAMVALSVLLPVIQNVLPALIVAMIEQGSIRRFLLALAGAGVLFAGAKWLQNSLQQKNLVYAQKCRMEAITRFYRKYATTSYQNVEPHGKQVDFQNAFSALNGDNWGIGQFFRKTPLFVYNLIGLVLYAGFLTAIDVKILLILIAMTVSCLVFERVSYRYQQRSRPEEGACKQDTFLLRNYCCGIENAKDIRLYGIENWFPKRMKQVYDRRIRINANIWGRMKLMDISNAVFLVARDIVAYGLLIRQVLAGQLSVAEFTFFIGIISGFTAWLTEMVTNFSYLRKAAIQQGYLRAYMEMDDCLMQGSGEELAPLSCPPSIEFRDVTFTYPETDRPVLEHLNLTIRPGQKIALVGANGAGKTTLVKLLTGLYRPDSGEILLGGRNIESYSQEEYFDLIGTVFQEPFLMAFSIEENIACCDEQQADHQRVCRCLQRAGLWERIERLPKGVKTPYSKELYEDGESFSGGEAQRLMLARALYKDAPVMVLDEPTAALDPLAEAQMYAQYNDLTADKTSIFISHRLSSTQFCDRVLYLEGGKIVEDGTHQQLMALGGSYAKMFAYQAYYYQKRLGERPDEQ
jgi:ATP-binding cassette subfamily B protein